MERLYGSGLIRKLLIDGKTVLIQHESGWLPPVLEQSEGKQRRIGVEIELAGIEPELLCNSISSLYGGEIKQHTALEYLVTDTKMGDFVVELDTSYLKALAEKYKEQNIDNTFVNALPMELITKAAEQIVPWEVVTPPMPISKLNTLTLLLKQLRESGALGTRHALHFAFGVHLNPELPRLDVTTVLSYLRAYFCLYDWIVMHEDTDLARRLTTYIKHFDKDYVKKIVDLSYQPSIDQLIDDYLLYNPTRNRSLDMLPLFAYLDKDRVNGAIKDPRIKARPTFHYRLPNCDIDNPEWNIDLPWFLWLHVEKLAAQPQLLATLCDQYTTELAKILNPFGEPWRIRVGRFLRAHELGKSS